MQWYFNGIIDKIKKISGDYEKDYTKIKLNSHDDLPWNKQLKFHNMAVTIRYVFGENVKLYPRVFLDHTLYELNVAIVYIKENAYRIHFWYMSKDDATNIMTGSNLVDKRGVL